MKNKPFITAISIVMLTMALMMAIFPAGTEARTNEMPMPTPAKHEKEDKPDTPPTSSIELFAFAPVATWTVVQWQGSDGNWHDIDGWRGQTDINGRVKWSVSLKDFGTGPFRWQVFAAGEGRPPLISEPFNLPAKADETLVVTVAQK